MKFTKIMLVAMTALLVLGCGEGKYESLSSSELAKKMRHCDSIPKKSAVFANGCEKISKEVERRRKQKSKN